MNPEERATSFKFGVAFGQFSAQNELDYYKAAKNVLSWEMQKALPSYEELIKTPWWEFDPGPLCFDNGCYEIGLLAYFRFLLSLPGHLDPNERSQKAQQTEERLYEEFESQSHPAKVLEDFLSSLDDNPNDALKIFVDKFARSLVSDVARLLAQGESETVEFKSVLKAPRDTDPRGRKAVEEAIAKSVAGFLNREQGGTLIIGVEDDGSPIEGDLLKRGEFTNTDEAQRHLLDLLIKKLGVNAADQTSIAFNRINGKLVLVVSCTFDINVFPVYVSQDEPSANRIFYARMGPSTQPLAGEEHLDYIDSVRSKFTP